jgi:ABC-2 type transport system ATP-binding protein
MPGMQGTILEATDVAKRFGATVAVDGVTFDVARHEIFALLGPNGAGKTTLLRMLAGLILPDGGGIRYTRDDGVTAPLLPAPQVGYLPEERGLYQDVPLLRTLVHFGVLRGMERADATLAAQTWLARMSLGDRARADLKTLSKGNQQKVQFISAVLHRPRFVLLDEPFSGLDPLNQDLFLGMIRELRENGTTVILSAHQMQLIERIADRIVVLNHGRIVLGGTLSDIRRRWRTGTRLVLRVGADPDLAFLERHAATATARLLEPGAVELFVRAGAPLGPVLAAAATHLDIHEVESHPVTLHDVYVASVTDGTVRGDAAPAAQASA